MNTVEFRIVMLNGGQTKDARHIGVGRFPKGWDALLPEGLAMEQLSMEFIAIDAKSEEAIRNAGQKVKVVDES